MGILTDIFDMYQGSSDTKKNIIYNKLIKVLWKSKCKYIKQERHIRFMIDNGIKNEELIELFSPYTDITYKVFKSSYGKNVSSIDYVKIRVNNLYAYLFDTEVYYSKEYYTELFVPKNEYYNVLKAPDKANVKEITQRINKSILNAEKLKQKNIDKKYELTWNEYKKLINKYLKNILDNYKGIDEYIAINGWVARCNSPNWDNDNYIIGYINKSLTMYLRNYIKETTKFYDNYKWKHSSKTYIPINIAKEYSPIQLCLSKYYDDVEKLKSVSWSNEFTEGQKKFISNVEKIINNSDLKNVILFNSNGTPKINESFISKQIGVSRVAVNKMIAKIYCYYNK